MLELQSERAVGCGRVEPHGIDLAGERAAELRGAHCVGVHAQLDDPALGRVTVGVVAEQGRGEQERQTPQHKGGPADVDAVVTRVEAQPSRKEHQDADEEDGGGHDAPCAVLQRPQQPQAVQRRVRREERRSERAHEYEARSKGARTHRWDGPGADDRVTPPGEDAALGALDRGVRCHRIQSSCRVHRRVPNEC